MRSRWRVTISSNAPRSPLAARLASFWSESRPSTRPVSRAPGLLALGAPPAVAASTVQRMQDFAAPAVRDGLLVWAAEQLTALRRGPVLASEQPHVCPWGTVLRLETLDGPLWLKASTPALAHEGD